MMSLYGTLSVAVGRNTLLQSLICGSVLMSIRGYIAEGVDFVWNLLVLEATTKPGESMMVASLCTYLQSRPAGTVLACTFHYDDSEIQEGTRFSFGARTYYLVEDGAVFRIVPSVADYEGAVVRFTITVMSMDGEKACVRLFDRALAAHKAKVDILQIKVQSTLWVHESDGKLAWKAPQTRSIRSLGHSNQIQAGGVQPQFWSHADGHRPQAVDQRLAPGHSGRSGRH